MSKKSTAISQRIEAFCGREFDPHYYGFFDCFNRQLYFEAHDVLEELWLCDRSGPDGLFYKGLIQLAGAFVHLKKKRTGPAAALFRLAEKNLKPYGPNHRQLDVSAVLKLVEQYVAKIEAGGLECAPSEDGNSPIIELLESPRIK